MKKYFKPLTPIFFFHLIGALIWIHLLISDTTLYTWFKIVMLLCIITSLLSYIRFERIDFSFFLNLFWRAKHYIKNNIF